MLIVPEDYFHNHHVGWRAWPQAWRHGAKTIAERFHLDSQSMMEKETNWEHMGLLNLKICPKYTSPSTKPNHLTFLKQFRQLQTKYSNT